MQDKRVSLSYERLVEICQNHYNNPREQIKSFVRDHEWENAQPKQKPACGECGHDRLSHEHVDGETDDASFGKCGLIGCKCEHYKKPEK